MTKANSISVIKILGFILVFSFCLDKLVFITLNSISDKVMTGQAVGKLNHFLKIKDTSDIIAFGSSRTNRHIDVSKLPGSTFNIGLDGTEIAYAATLIQTLPAHKEQLVILNLDTKNLFNKNYTGSDIRALKVKYQRDPIFTKALNASGLLNPLQKFYWSINYNNRALGIIKNYLTPKYDYKAYNGFDPIRVADSQKNTRDKFLLAPNANPCAKSYTINPTALKHLKAIVKFCKDNNKSLVAITAPQYDDNCNSDNIKLKKVAQSLALTYWDYTNVFKQHPSTDLWKDKTHLAEDGASLFTNSLLKKLLTEGYIAN